MMKKLKNKKIIIPIIILFILLFLFFLITDFQEEQLRVHFIDIGQGDAILIQSPQGNNILIDGGDRFSSVAEKLTTYLHNQNVRSLQAIVSTHPHADHIGGLSAIIEEFKVEKIYDSGRVHTTRTYENYLAAILEADIPYYTPRRGEQLEIGDLIFNVLHPGEDIEKYSLNEASIVLHLQFGEISFLLTGDAEYQAEREMVDSGKNLKANILKLPHHGSSSSSNDFFLDAVAAEIAVIQVGEGNRYGHPHQEVLAELKARDIDIYRNDLHGDIVVISCGEEYSVEISGVRR